MIPFREYPLVTPVVLDWRYLGTSLSPLMVATAASLGIAEQYIKAFGCIAKEVRINVKY
ncbi:unnamed protein product [Musa acuminata subsp. malaccensis]|uniref:(wild Malaysian banana) hypothetical protein n=1 Tax=Musa acuminata subsp. malaccensis TaxID=214687 RepID=A0A804IRF7_MUSAM|nr:unnamed protein product [Musa acuminata subsp. malaccensis]